VRQGDPLSPYLFILAADFLPVWFEALSRQNLIIKPFPQCRQCLLYADDTLFIIQPEEQQVRILKALLNIYGKISGLKVNLQKSRMLVTSVDHQFVQMLADIMECVPSNFPITYLGMPLSDRRLTKEHFKALIMAIQSKLQGWKASLLSSGGRLTLLNSTLSTIPIFFMSTFMLPIWVINEIDKIRRRFLWHGHKEQIQRRYMSPISWDMVTRPKNMGGLGVLDLKIMNQALMAKNIWHFLVRRTLREIDNSNEHGRPWLNIHATPFWSSLKQMEPLFSISLNYTIRNGEIVRLWHDAWQGPLRRETLSILYTFVYNQHMTVKQVKDITDWDSQF
jgi:Reverse transcriptase (RNA-dependent DNA polymerase)